jgi:glycosyltransferase involved in cell wall biosynthesis
MESILIAGNSGGTNVGQGFFNAAEKLGLSPLFFDYELAYKAPYWLKQFNWRIRGKYPSKLKQFGEELVQTGCRIRPRWLLTTGIAPVSDGVLQQIGAMGIQRFNFLTDDPWNPAHSASWFFKALMHYDTVFSPRQSIVDDLVNLGCRRVEYLPFAYDPDLFYPERSSSGKLQQGIADVVFVGGADSDRIPYLQALIHAGMKVDLYGAYWDRYPETKGYAYGQADMQTQRAVIGCAKIALCLVRRANRDGHCMRTFEVPAVGACMLTENTPEHREILGADGESVVYFSTIEEMVEKACWLLEHDTERQRLAVSVHQRITQGTNTYCDRLKTMLSL